jgi:hypothetical protein
VTDGSAVRVILGYPIVDLLAAVAPRRPTNLTRNAATPK